MKKGKLIGSIVAVLAVIAITVAAIIFFINNNKNPLIGRWEYEGGSWAYEFTSDTEGSYNLSTISSSKFTYEIDEDDMLNLTYEDGTNAVLDYRIEGDKLIIKDIFEDDIVYIKQ